MSKIKKWIQRLVINAIIFHPPPLVVLVSVFGLVFLIGFYCAHVIDQIDIVKYKPYSSIYDNIAGIPTKNWMPEIFPVDVVYTWVNGSDSELHKNFEIYGKLMQNFHEKCPFRNCILSPYYIIEKTSQSILALRNADDIEIIKEHPDTQRNSSTSLIFTISENENIDRVAYWKVKLNITCRNTLFWTSDFHVESGLAWENTLLFKSVYEHDGLREQDLSKFPKECRIYVENDLSAIECSGHLGGKLSDILNDGIRSFNTWPAYLAPLKKCEREHDNNLNRYSDNGELKYSLRSVEKYMPWVRRIFIVTNGQIPHWLNMANSRVTIVSHEEIFRNLSHLPTFSSPAIEANIHRIPDLSEHFIYFNDDIFLGAPVWPEDFYSPSDGYKVYLSWHLNDCSPGCNSSWINDHYCDEACNTSACHYDGGDCDHDATASVEQSDLNLDGFKTSANACSPLCTDEWLADSFCDMSCQVASCGFDCGDCGTQLIRSRMLQLTVPRNPNQALSVAKGQLAVWFNLSRLFNESGSDVVGSFSQSAGVRIMAINAVSQIAILVFRRNFTDSAVIQFDFGDKSHNRSTHVSFTLNYDTYTEKPRSKLMKNVPVENFTYFRVAPQSLNLTSYRQLQHSAQNSMDTEEQLADLKHRFEDGQLTEKGFRWKKLALTQNSSVHFIPARMEKPDDALQRGVRKFLWERRHNPKWEDHVPHIQRARKRRLLYIFTESLQFVNRLYNDVYGFQVRKVPAHVPFFINKTLLKELVFRFSSRFDLTSSHKFRSSTDMQFSFSYYHYLMGETTTRTVSEIFSMIDTDNSGTWADRELRTFMAMSKDLPVYFSDLLTVHEDLKACSKIVDVRHSITPLYERYPDSDLPTITEQLIANCINSSIAERLKTFAKRATFRYKIISEQISHFKMISSNISEIVITLDELRKHQRKFVCLNNDMEPGSADNYIIRAMVSHFYESVLPIPSAFELTDNYRNKFYVEELQSWKWQRNLYRAYLSCLIWASLSCLFFLLLLSQFRREVETIRNRLCRRRRKFLKLAQDEI